MRPIYFLTGAFLVSTALLFQACDKGDPGPAGPSAVPAPACSSPSANGVTTASLPATTNWGGSYLETQAVTLAGNETVTGISVYFTGAVTEQVNFAVYTDNGSLYPDHLVFQTNPQFITDGWNTASVPNIYLPSGIYHMVFVSSYNGSGTYNSTPYSSSGNLNYYGSLAWGVYPTTFPSSIPSDAWSIPLYLSTCP